MVFILPTERSTASKKLSDYSILLHGDQKIGKTTLAAQFPDAFFFMFEPGSKSLEIFQYPIRKWEDFKEGCIQLARDKRFKNVILDTADIAYLLCMEFCCKQMGIDHPSDGDHGKGWNRVRVEFTKAMSYISSIGKGVVFISHSVEKELKDREGVKIHRIVPTLSGQAYDILAGMVDIMIYYRYEENGSRTMVVKGSEGIAAGTRTEKNFVGLRTIPGGNSPQEAYANLVRGFNNELAVAVPAPSKSAGLKLKLGK